MNAYAIGQLAGMQKQALSTKGWTRLLDALKREGLTKGLESKKLRGYINSEVADRLKRRLPLAQSSSGGFVKSLLPLIKTHEAGLPLTGAESIQLRKYVESMLKMRDPAATMKSIAPRSVPFERFAKRVPRHYSWRGTSLPKDIAMKPGTDMWVSGSPDVSAIYSLTGGEMPRTEAARVLLKRTSPKLTYKAIPGIKYYGQGGLVQQMREYKLRGRKPPSAASLKKQQAARRHDPYYEAIIKAPKDPLGDVVQGWRVFDRGLPDIDKAMQRRLRAGGVPLTNIPKTSTLPPNASAADILRERQAAFVPISRRSLEKWREALSVPTIGVPRWIPGTGT